MLKKIFYGLVLTLSLNSLAQEEVESTFEEFSKEYKDIFGEEPAQIWQENCNKAGCMNGNCGGGGNNCLGN